MSERVLLIRLRAFYETAFLGTKSALLFVMLNENLPAFQNALLHWYQENGRSFPWRNVQDAFAVLLSEKLLQQTAARPVVVNIFNILLKDFPTPEALAHADVTALEELIRPLGFLYRARELPQLARVIIQRHKGRVPASLKELLALPGVGDYAARAVLSFAFQQDMPIVDTNVARWIYRIDGITDPLPKNPARKKSLIARAGELVPYGKSRDWNYGVLDLCALICKPGKPLCPVCPVQTYCTYGNSFIKTPK